ncbi:MAG: hypothetical protein ACMXX9_03060 [Candidatus Woesearchaeota archaeon]
MKKLNLLLGFLLALPVVSAQGLPIPDVLNSTVQALFGGLENIAYQRLILFIGIFTIFYAVLQTSKVFGDKATNKKGISITLALVLGAIATMSMPADLVASVFNVYSGLLGIIILFGPALYLIYYAYAEIDGGNKGGHLARFFILIIISALFMSQTFLSQIGLLETIGAITYIEFFGFIIFIFALIELARAFGNSGKGDPDSKPSEPWGDGLTDWFSRRNNKKRNKKVADEPGLSWFDDKANNKLDKDVQKEFNLEKKQKEELDKIKDLEESVKELDIKSREGLKGIKNIVEALYDIQGTDNFKDRNKRINISGALKKAVDDLKKITEQHNDVYRAKKIVEDDILRSARKLLQKIDDERKIVEDNTLLSDDDKNELNNQFINIERKLKVHLDHLDNIKKLKRKTEQIITDLLTKIDGLDRTITNLYNASTSGDSAREQTEIKNYKDLIEDMKTLVDQLVKNHISIETYNNELTSEDLSALVTEKDRVVREFNEKIKSLQKPAEQIKLLQSQFKDAKTVDEQEDIVGEIGKIESGLPENSTLKKITAKLLAEDAQIISETFNKKNITSSTISDEDKQVLLKLKGVINSFNIMTIERSNFEVLEEFHGSLKNEGVKKKVWEFLEDSFKMFKSDKAPDRAVRQEYNHQVKAKFIAWIDKVTK